MPTRRNPPIGILTRSSPVAVSARDGDGPLRKLVGYAARFGSESSPLLDGPIAGNRPFVEVIRPGAFARTLKDNPDVLALRNHDTSAVLGRTRNGTLTIGEDSEGLSFEVTLPNTREAEDVWTLIREGYADGCSFGFSVVENELVERDGKLVHELIDVDLSEISVAVAFPAYDAASAAARSRNRRGPVATPRLNRARRLRDLLSQGIPIYSTEGKQ